jgi:uncharacterized membrane protein
LSGFEELDTIEPLKLRIERQAYDRLILLSDGVFAIAFTLAALEVKPPGAWRDLQDLVGQLRYPVLTYAISFAVIAQYWGGQRDLVSRLVKIDGPMTVLMLAQLFCVALIPSATQLILRQGPDAHAVTIYGGLLATCGYLAAGSWAYGALHPALLHPECRSLYAGLRVATALIVPAVFTWIAITGGSLGAAPIAAIVAVMAMRRLVINRFPGAETARAPKPA